MAFIDHTAAATIRDLREEAGYNSPEALADAIKLASKTADWGRRGTVDAWTIRAVERGHVPGPRIRFILASYFGSGSREIWIERNWQVASSSVIARSEIPA